MPKPFIPFDSWAKKAKIKGFRARSVFKLQELNERFGLLVPGMTVLDLGAAPGSWLQEASGIVGPQGKVIGMDLEKIEPVGTNVATHVADITDIDAIIKILKDAGATRIDCVLSDLAPKTSGIKDVDQWKSVELNRCVLEIARRFLAPRGHCVLKVFRGADFDDFLRECKSAFTHVKQYSPKASRDRSREIYLVLREKQ